MKCKVLCYAIKVPYPTCTIDVIIGKDMVSAYMKRFGKINSLTGFLDDTIDGCFLWHTGTNYIIVLPEEWDPSIVYHECLHAATRIWYDVGADLEVPQNDEVLTYMMNYLAKRIEGIYNANKE